MPAQLILYIDMDDVLCNYSAAFQKMKAQQPDIQYPQSIPGFFEQLEPVDHAVQSFLDLAGQYDIHILSAPSVFNPLCYTEKRLWVEHHLGFEFVHKLILATNKGLLKGDCLIDDYIAGRGQENFDGELIHFGSEKFPDWLAIMAYFESRTKKPFIQIPNEIAELTATVFANSAEAELWLNTPLNALSGDTPMARLRTDHGVKEVTDVLRKIESGEFT